MQRLILTLSLFLSLLLMPASAFAQKKVILVKTLPAEEARKELEKLARQLGLDDTSKLELISYKEYDPKVNERVPGTKVWTFHETPSRVTKARLRALRGDGVWEFAVENGRSTSGAEQLLTDWGDMTSREIRGLAELEYAFSRTEEQGDLHDVLKLPNTDRNQLLKMVGIVEERADIRSGLGRAVNRYLSMTKGSSSPGDADLQSAALQRLCKQLVTVIDLLEEFVPDPYEDPRAKVEFEASEASPFGQHDIDVVIHRETRRMCVQIELGSSAGFVINHDQLRKDLAVNAENGWENLIYCLPTSKKADAAGLQAALLEAFEALARQSPFRDQLGKNPELKKVERAELSASARRLLLARFENGLFRYF